MAKYLNETENPISIQGYSGEDAIQPGDTTEEIPYLVDERGLTLVSESPTPHTVQSVLYSALPAVITNLKGKSQLIIKNLTNGTVFVHMNGNTSETGWPLVANEVMAINQRYEINKINLSSSTATSGSVYVLSK